MDSGASHCFLEERVLPSTMPVAKGQGLLVKLANSGEFHSTKIWFVPVDFAYGI